MLTFRYIRTYTAIKHFEISDIDVFLLSSLNGYFKRDENSIIQIFNDDSI